METKIFRKFFLLTYAAIFVVYFLIGMLPAASAEDYRISETISIPEIGLSSQVASLSLNENTLTAPGQIAGSYQNAKNKLLIIGHAKTVFHNLAGVSVGDKINLQSEKDGFSGIYTISKVEMLPKSEIKMQKVLEKADRPTIVLMTCAGEMLSENDATMRLIVTAVKD